MDDGVMNAQREALGIIKRGLTERMTRRPQKAAPPEADGNVAEVMEREPEVEAAEEPAEEMAEEEPPKRTVLESFTPRIVRDEQPQEMLHVKRGPGRPRKVR